jgi:23S rRNA (uracil1939-C5)-methyltransferase
VAQVLAERLSDATALFVDPPRKGLDAGSLAAILAARPQRLAYLSCDPSTLARDLGRLCADCVYELRWVQALDLFPNTSHVETLAVLSCAAGL